MVILGVLTNPISVLRRMEDSLKFQFLFIIVFLLDLMCRVLAVSVSLKDAYVFLEQPFQWSCQVEDTGMQGTSWLFHWRHEDADVVGGDADGILVGNGTLSFKKVKEENLGVYTCVATDGRTVLEVDAFLKKAFVSEVISTQPTNQTIEIGSSSTFSCIVDSKPEPSVTWFQGEKEIDEHDNGVEITADEGNFTLEIKRVTYDDSGEYRCAVHHNLLSQPLLSDTMHLKVVGPPVILVGPKTVTVPIGYNISLPCRVRSNPGSSVTWNIYQSSTDPSSSSSSSSTYTLSKGDSPINIAQTVVSLNKEGDLILITNASNYTNGVYSCEWRNEFGYLQLNASVTVEGSPQPPEFTNISTHQTIEEFSELRLLCAAKGNPSVRVSWILPNGTGNGIDDIEKDVGASVLVLKEVTRQDAGNYSCVISNIEGVDKTDVAVNILFKPHFITTPIHTSVEEASSAAIHCEADGNPKPTITWRLPGFDEKVVASSNNSLDNISFNGSSLVIHDARSINHGFYQCVATNNLGSIDASAHVTVSAGPTIVSPLTSVGVTEGDEVLLSCDVLSFQIPTANWFHKFMIDVSIEAANVNEALEEVSHKHFNATEHGFTKIEGSQELSSTFTTYEDVTNDKYTHYLQIHSIKEKHAGIYVLQVTNDKGATHTFGVVRVITFPKFVTAPSTRKVHLGENTIFDCHAVGIPVPSQRWLFSGRRLITNPRYVVHINGSLSVSNITEQEIGYYTCLARNQAGDRLANANLLLSSKPRLVGPPTNKTFLEYKEGRLPCKGYSDLCFSVEWHKVGRSGEHLGLVGNITVDNNSVEYSVENVRTSLGVDESNVYVDNTGTLVFKCVERVHQGWYLCKLKNDDGSSESDPVFVQVEKIPNEITIISPSSKPIAGAGLELRCSVDDLTSSIGNISWITPRLVEVTQSRDPYYPEIDIENTEALLQDTQRYISVMNITGVSNARHGGNWWCKTCNAAGCSVQKTTLVFEDKPVVRQISSSVSEIDVTISCRYYGNPDTTITFLSKGIEINNDTKGHVVSKHTLVIDVDELKSEYSCEISNVHGSDIKTIGLPPSPTITDVIPGKSSLHVSVNTRMVDFDDSITKLILEYKKSESENNWENLIKHTSGDLMNYFGVFRDLQEENLNKTCGDSANDVDENTVNSHNPVQKFREDLKLSVEASGDSYLYSFQTVISNLDAYTLYSVKARIVNLFGSSLSSEVAEMRTLSSAPSSVYNIKVSAENKSCILTWDNPVSLNGNPDDIGIYIYVSQGRTVYSKMAPVTEPPTAKFVCLSLGEYLVTITAFNLKTNATSGGVQFQFNNQDQPSDYIPEILEIRSVTHSSITVLWKTPDNLDTLKPPVTGYEILLEFTNAESRAAGKFYVNSGHTSNQTITKLREHEEYSVRIASTNQVGSSPYSTPKRVTTRYAAFSQMALDSSSGIEGYSISWTLIAIIVIATGAAFIFLTAFLVFSYQWRLAKRGSVDITPEPTTHDNNILNESLEELDPAPQVVADTYRDSDFILY